MAIDLEQQWFRGLTQLRYAATPKRLRALLDGQTVLDTRDALLVYEPRRVVPWYAVPPGDLHLNLTEHDPFPVPELRAAVLPPHHNKWHTVPGRSLHLERHGEVAFGRPPHHDAPDEATGRARCAICCGGAAAPPPAVRAPETDRARSGSNGDRRAGRHTRGRLGEARRPAAHPGYRAPSARRGAHGVASGSRRTGAG